MNKSKVIVSLDYSNAKQALDFCQKVNPMDCRIKVGKELFTAEGPKLIEKLRKLDYEIFLDLKYHDISFVFDCYRGCINKQSNICC